MPVVAEGIKSELNPEMVSEKYSRGGKLALVCESMGAFTFEPLSIPICNSNLELQVAGLWRQNNDAKIANIYLKLVTSGAEGALYKCRLEISK